MVLKIVLDNARVNRFFRNNYRFVEDLTDDVKTYRQDNGEIAVVVDFIREDITKETMDYLQKVCESIYFKFDETPVNMYVITLNCRLLVNEYSMPSIATFTIKMCCRDYSYL